MPSRIMKLYLLCIGAACISLIGCSNANDLAPAMTGSGSHPGNWLTSHRAVYRLNPSQCRECHGVDLKGGIARVDCFNQAALGQCHAGGHGPRDIIHPVPFKDPALHGPMARADLTVCRDCHGTAGGAGSNPRFTVPFGSLPAGCESPGCHNPGMAHPKPWLNHRLSGNQPAACALCHGATYAGGAGSACVSCHSKLAVGTIPALGQCVSCHSNPPNGATVPNRAGSHETHLALPSMAGNCAACHSGGGSGTSSHGTSLKVAFASGFNATAGATAFTGTVCTNISCHGGATTPVWGGTLDVATSCMVCHQSGTQTYIGYNSGRHSLHLGIGVICTDCHDMANDAAHFGNVTSKIFETAPATTLRSFLRYAQASGSCMVITPTPPGVQFTGCHGGTEVWR